MRSSSHMVLECGRLARVAQGNITDARNKVSGDAVKMVTLSASKKKTEGDCIPVVRS